MSALACHRPRPQLAPEIRRGAGARARETACLLARASRSPQ
ncbi:MAG TPA: hypothetical protein VLC54_02415 [Anaeromyxobacter sp.]|nr:hypothetical protein [Anaeromyxobacter sp.]